MTGRLDGLDPGDAYFWHTRTILFPFLLMSVIHVISSLRLVTLRWQWMPRSGWVDAIFLTSGALLLLGVMLLI